MANILGFVGIGVSVVVLLFSILAISLSYWVASDNAGIKINSGLWEVCIEVGSNKQCSDIDADFVGEKTFKDIRTVRAMVMLGLLLSAAAIVAGILVMFVLKSTKLLFFVAGGLDIAAGLFLMIGMAVYVDKLYDEDQNQDLHVAFALDIIAWIAAWVAGGIFIAANIMEKE